MKSATVNRSELMTLQDAAAVVSAALNQDVKSRNLRHYTVVGCKDLAGNKVLLASMQSPRGTIVGFEDVVRFYRCLQAGSHDAMTAASKVEIALRKAKADFDVASAESAA